MPDWLWRFIYRIPWLAPRLPRRKTKRKVRRISNVGAFVEVVIYVFAALVIVGAIAWSFWK